MDNLEKLRQMQALGGAGDVGLGQQGVERHQQVQVDTAKINHIDGSHSSN
jgi:hypothetical protein